MRIDIFLYYPRLRIHKGIEIDRELAYITKKRCSTTQKPRQLKDLFLILVLNDEAKILKKS